MTVKWQMAASRQSPGWINQLMILSLPVQGAQLPSLRKKIHVKEKNVKTDTSWSLSGEIELTSPFWALGWSYSHAWKPKRPVAGDPGQLLKGSHKYTPHLCAITGFHTFSLVPCSKQCRGQTHASIDWPQLHTLPPSENRVLRTRTYLMEMADCNALSFGYIQLKV